MGTTFVSIGDHGFWMRDGILELWLRLLALNMEDPLESGSVATKIRNQWLLASRGFFTGCIPDGLQEAVSTADGEQLVRLAIQSLMQRLAEAPHQISKDALNLLGFEGTWTKDVETEGLMEVGQAFLNLLDGKIVSDATDTSFIPGSR